MNITAYTSLFLALCLILHLCYFLVIEKYQLDFKWVYSKEEEGNTVPYLKPQNFDEDCKMDTNCDDNCNVCCQLPYHKQTGKVKIINFTTK